MIFDDKLRRVKSTFQSELRLLLEFVDTTEKTLTESFKKKPDQELSESDKTDLDKIFDFTKGKTGDTQITIESDAVASFLLSKIVPFKHKMYLNEMSLSYMISFQEALLKEYLYTILIENIECLKSKTSIQYKTLLEFGSIEEVHEYIVKHEVDTIGYGSIDDMSKYYQDKFNIKFNEFENWSELVEATYRRNLFIHNQGICNDKYVHRFPDASSKLGSKMSFDCDYVNMSVERLMEFNEFLYCKICDKFGTEA